MLSLVFCALIVSCGALQVKYQPCTYKGNGPVNPISSIDISPMPAGGCDHTLPGSPVKFCQFQSGASYNGTITFHAGEASQTALSKAYGNLGLSGLEEFGVSPPDACTNGVQCPITAGTDVTYRASVQVPVHKAGIKGVAEWQVIGDNDKAIICFVFPFVIGA